jgi:hypothetical protein
VSLQLVCDVTRTDPDLWFPALGLIFVAIAAVMVYGVHRARTVPWANVLSVSRASTFYVEHTVVTLDGEHPQISFYGEAGKSINRRFESHRLRRQSAVTHGSTSNDG